MADWMKGFLDVIKLPVRWLWPLALATGVLIFAPPALLKALGLESLVTAYRGWIGLAFLILSALILSGASVWLWNTVLPWLCRPLVLIYLRHAMRTRLRKLSEEEKQILRYYVHFSTRTNTLLVGNGAVQALVGARIITPASKRGNVIEGFPFMLTDIADELLNEDHSVLVGTTNTYYTNARLH